MPVPLRKGRPTDLAADPKRRRDGRGAKARAEISASAAVSKQILIPATGTGAGEDVFWRKTMSLV